MISRIRGEIVSRGADRVELLTPGGVVYEVHVPARVAETLPPEGRTVELLTTLVAKDDNHALYGFRHEHERTLFARLRTVPKVGAASALAVMSAYTAGRVAQAVADRDRTALMAVKGIGKKTADLIVVTLHGRLDDLAQADPGEDTHAKARSEAVAALVSLGLSFGEADQGVREASRGSEPLATQDLVRRVLARRSQRPGGPRE